MRARVSGKGQVVIPQEARELLQIREGTELEVQVQDGRLVLEKAQSGSWRSWRGRFRKIDLTGALEESHRAETQRES